MKNTVVFESADAATVVFIREGKFAFNATRELSQTCNGDSSNPYEQVETPIFELRVQYEFNTEGMLLMTATLETIAMAITGLTGKLSRNEATLIFFVPIHDGKRGSV